MSLIFRDAYRILITNTQRVISKINHFQIAEKLSLIREDNTVFDKKYHSKFQEYINKDISN